jgi:hypothetical protein
VQNSARVQTAGRVHYVLMYKQRTRTNSARVQRTIAHSQDECANVSLGRAAYNRQTVPSSRVPDTLSLSLTRANSARVQRTM